MKLHIQVAERKGRWHAWVPAIPGVEATGDTQSEAVEMVAAIAVSRLANWRELTHPEYAVN